MWIHDNRAQWNITYVSFNCLNIFSAMDKSYISWYKILGNLNTMRWLSLECNGRYSQISLQQSPSLRAKWSLKTIGSLHCLAFHILSTCTCELLQETILWHSFPLYANLSILGHGFPLNVILSINSNSCLWRVWLWYRHMSMLNEYQSFCDHTAWCNAWKLSQPITRQTLFEIHATWWYANQFG